MLVGAGEMAQPSSRTLNALAEDPSSIPTWSTKVSLEMLYKYCHHSHFDPNNLKAEETKGPKGPTQLASLIVFLFQVRRLKIL